jgi:hypothetical protein
MAHAGDLLPKHPLPHRAIDRAGGGQVQRLTSGLHGDPRPLGGRG